MVMFALQERRIVTDHMYGVAPLCVKFLVGRCSSTAVCRYAHNVNVTYVVSAPGKLTTCNMACRHVPSMWLLVHFRPGGRQKFPHSLSCNMAGLLHTRLWHQELEKLCKALPAETSAAILAQIDMCVAWQNSHGGSVQVIMSLA